MNRVSHVPFVRIARDSPPQFGVHHPHDEADQDHVELLLAEEAAGEHERVHPRRAEALDADQYGGPAEDARLQLTAHPSPRGA